MGFWSHMSGCVHVCGVGWSFCCLLLFSYMCMFSYRCLYVCVQCQSTLVQFISFLSLQLSTDELVKRLPDIHDLLTTYHIPTEVAFALWRIVYASSISVSCFSISYSVENKGQR